MRLDEVAADHVVVPGWNRVLNRALPWFATETADEPCMPADQRFTITDGYDGVVAIAERRTLFGRTQLLVAVDPSHRGRGLGTALAEAVDPRRAEEAEVFIHDPADPAAAALASGRGFRLDDQEPLVLWSLDPQSAGMAAAPPYLVSTWTGGGVRDLEALREAVRWWATDNALDEDSIRAWQDRLPGEFLTTVARDAAGDIVGVAWALPVPHTTAWRATHVAVSPQHRGRGVGLALKSGQSDFARSAGVTDLVTQISAGSRANSLWQRLAATRRDLRSWVR